MTEATVTGAVGSGDSADCAEMAWGWLWCCGACCHGLHWHLEVHIVWSCPTCTDAALCASYLLDPRHQRCTVLAGDGSDTACHRCFMFTVIYRLCSCPGSAVSWPASCWWTCCLCICVCGGVSVNACTPDETLPFDGCVRSCAGYDTAPGDVM